MKLLLLFTFLSLACYGQGQDTIQLDLIANMVGSNEISAFDKLSLEEKLLLYAQECFNDSTVHKYTVHIVEGGVDADDDPDSASACIVYPEYPDKCVNPRHHYETRSETIHRKPTFEGFIEWLRKNK